MIFGWCALFPQKTGMTLVHQQLWTPETLTRSKLILPVLPTEAPIPPATAISVLRALQEFQQFFIGFFHIFSYSGTLDFSTEQTGRMAIVSNCCPRGGWSAKGESKLVSFACLSSSSCSYPPCPNQFQSLAPTA